MRAVVSLAYLGTSGSPIRPSVTEILIFYCWGADCATMVGVVL